LRCKTAKFSSNLAVLQRFLLAAIVYFMIFGYGNQAFKSKLNIKHGRLKFDHLAIMLKICLLSADPSNFTRIPGLYPKFLNF